MIKAKILKYKRNQNALSAEETRANMAPSDYVEELIELKREIDNAEDQMDLACIKLKMDINIALLKKCLPDMKAVEIQQRTDQVMTIGWKDAPHRT